MGSRYQGRDGYIYLFTPGHPNADQNGYVKEHRLVVERMVQRFLTKEEVIHHLDFNRTNNQIDNLMLFPNQRSHSSFHKKIIQFGYTNPMIKQIKERWNGQ
jgi:hypothetical protein